MIKIREINSISRTSNAVLTFLTGLLALLCLYPVLLLIAVSFSDEKSISDYGYRLLPAKFSTAAYHFVFTQNTGIGHSYLVTIFVTVVGTLLSLAVCALIAYPLSRHSFKYRNAFSFYVFFTMLFSGGLVPSYIINTQYLHLTNTVWALILPGAANAFNIILLRTYLTANVPDAIIESAKMDGAGDFATFLKIVLPISGPGLATIGLFLTIGFWNDWFNSLLYINDNNLVPLQLLLKRVQDTITLLTQNSDQFTVEQKQQFLSSLPAESARMAMVVLSIGPIVLAYPYCQKYFVKGITIGAVKG